MNPNLLIREAQSSEYETVANLTMAAYRPLFTELDLPEDTFTGRRQYVSKLSFEDSSWWDDNVTMVYVSDDEVNGTGLIDVSSLTAGSITTSSPFFQFAGVATLCFAVNCIESIDLNNSIKFLPVAIG
mgnify:CR=1 FL=1